MIDITKIIVAVIGLAAALVAAFLVPWLKSLTTEKQREALAAVIKTLVYAAEQIYAGTGRGEEKLEYVIRELKARGYTVDLAEIEAAVKKYFPKLEYVPPDQH